ncbi:substrate-binding periplasmic protein [Salinibius halmophilus]|uniref:substrate-binding periplasmic protein n=1 Tax=Salinibius halmophilus TaxID=1853216 RepID=UPI000E6660CE|nr:transporter substrate-binding domain-containing protein [Salinibius halmophilus]
MFQTILSVALLTALVGLAQAKAPLTMISAEVVTTEFTDYITALEKTMASSGLQFHHQSFPDQRYNVVLEQGMFDVATLVSTSQIEQSGLLKIEPYITYAYIYMFYNDQLDLTDLNNKTMAIVNGTTFPIPYEKTYSLNRILVRSNDDALKMVSSGRADMTFLSNSANRFIEQLALTGIKQSDEPISSESFHIALPAKQSALAPVMSDVVKQMKEAGLYVYQREDGTVTSAN